MFGESGREKKAFTLDNTYYKWGGYLKKKMKKRGGEKKAKPSLKRRKSSYLLEVDTNCKCATSLGI